MIIRLSLLTIGLLLTTFISAQDLPHKTTYGKPNPEDKPVRGAIHFCFEPNFGYAYTSYKLNNSNRHMYSGISSLSLALQLYQKKESNPYFLRIQLIQVGIYYEIKHSAYPFIGTPGIGFGRRYNLSETFSFEPSLTLNAILSPADNVNMEPDFITPILLGKAKFNFNQFSLDLDASYLPYPSQYGPSGVYHSFYFGVSIGFYGVLRKYKPQS